MHWTMRCFACPLTLDAHVPRRHPRTRTGHTAGHDPKGARWQGTARAHGQRKYLGCCEAFVTFITAAVLATCPAMPFSMGTQALALSE